MSALTAYIDSKSSPRPRGPPSPFAPLPLPSPFDPLPNDAHTALQGFPLTHHPSPTPRVESTPPSKGKTELTCCSLSPAEQVLIITQDGRTIVGELKGFDQTTNVILSHSVERVYSLDEGVKEDELGLYVVRGDNIVSFFFQSCTLDASVGTRSTRSEQ